MGFDGLSDPRVGYEHSVVVDTCLLSIVTSLWILCASQTLSCVFLLCLRLKLCHFRDPGGFVHGQLPSFRALLKIAALSAIIPVVVVQSSGFSYFCTQLCN